MVQPARWSPPIDLSPLEERLVRLCKKAPLFVFLRRIRHELFDDAFQAQLAALYKASSRGQPPAPPALLAMAGLLQAATGVSDAEAVRLAATDRCWQMVLGTLDADDPPFAQGTLAAFRARLIAADADRALLDALPAALRHTAPRDADDLARAYARALPAELAAALGAAADALGDLAPEHRAAVDPLRAELRAMPLFTTVARAMGDAGLKSAAELATVLLLALPGGSFDAAPPHARAALESLRRGDLLSPALHAEVEVVREQLLALRDAFAPDAHCAAG